MWARRSGAVGDGEWMGCSTKLISLCMETHLWEGGHYCQYCKATARSGVGQTTMVEGISTLEITRSLTLALHFQAYHRYSALCDAFLTTFSGLKKPMPCQKPLIQGPNRHAYCTAQTTFAQANLDRMYRAGARGKQKKKRRAKASATASPISPPPFSRPWFKTIHHIPTGAASHPPNLYLRYHILVILVFRIFLCS
jgi:hypothetical protein